MKKSFVLTLAYAVTLLLCGCCLSHDWTEATCTAPKTCAKCEQTEGEPLGHQWQDATCAAPKTCAGCGITEGVKLKHTYGDEAFHSYNYVSAVTCYAKTCSGCGDQIMREVPLEALTDGTCFLMTPEEFCHRFTGKLTDMQYALGDDQYLSVLDDTVTPGSLKLYILKTDTTGQTWVIGEFDLYNADDNLLLPEQKDEANALRKIQGTVDGKDSALLAVLALWSTGDLADTLADKVQKFAKTQALTAEQIDIHTKINMYSLPSSKSISCKVTSKGEDKYELTLNVR